MAPFLLDPGRFGGGGGAGSAYAAAVLAKSPSAYYRLGDLGTYGTATSSTNFGSEPPSNAFDGNASTYWTTNAVSSGWLRNQLTGVAVVTGYSIRRRDDIPGRNPKDWTFEGSNNGTTWTTLDTRSGITWPTAGQTQVFTFANTTAYAYYRINISANNGDTYLSIAEMTFVGLGTGTMVDASTNLRHGTYVGSPTLGTTGLLTGDTDAAVRFATSGQYGLGPTTTGWNSDYMTLSTRIKIAATGSYQDVLKRDDGGSNRVFIFRISNANKVDLVFWDSGGTLHEVTGATSLSAATAYSVGAIFDGTTAQVTLNGVSDASLSFTGTLKQPAGGQALQVAGASDITLDEAAIFGSALTVADLAAFHAAA